MHPKIRTHNSPKKIYHAKETNEQILSILSHQEVQTETQMTYILTLYTPTEMALI